MAKLTSWAPVYKPFFSSLVDSLLKIRAQPCVDLTVWRCTHHRDHAWLHPARAMDVLAEVRPKMISGQTWKVE